MRTKHNQNRVISLAAGARRAGRKAVVVPSVALCLMASFVLLASPASASPSISVNCSTTSGSCAVNGSGFAPYGQVSVEEWVAGALVSFQAAVGSPPNLICVTGGVKPYCHAFGGGNISTVLPPDYSLACGTTAAGTVYALVPNTDVDVSEPITLTGPCPVATTTTLSVPTTVDTGWTGVNPAKVTAGVNVVTVGTVTISVNRSTVCSYTAGASSGCTLANLPVGTDQVEATYSGNSAPRYESSSATVTVTVLPAQASASTTDSTMAGYVATLDTYTSVSGTWTVPKGNCGTIFSNPLQPASNSDTFLGFGEPGTSARVDVGTTTSCAGWSEVYSAGWLVSTTPTVATPIAEPVKPGDVMDASVTSTGTPGSFNLALSDETHPWSWTATESLAGFTAGAAQWMTEDPSVLGSALTNFGSVTFTNCLATGSNGVATPIWDHPNLVVDMVAGSSTKATASPLSEDGTQFTINWLEN